MQPSEINRELDALEKRAAKNNETFIAAGRGHERPGDYAKNNDPISMEAKSIEARVSKLHIEIAMRCGPDAPRRMPRGFRPRTVEPS